MNVLDRVKEIKMVPVVVFKTLDDVKPTLDGLMEGGVPVAEICFRTACAEEAIKIAVKDYPDMLVGAGTVINADQAERAIAAGAKFLVSPGFSSSVCDVAQAHNVPYLPGIVTPTEIMMALDRGIDHVKFFPAGVFGGLKAIQAMGAAFPQVKFMPTGGVDNSNLKQFIECKSIYAIGGSWLLKGDIVKNCQEANAIIKGE